MHLHEHLDPPFFYSGYSTVWRQSTECCLICALELVTGLVVRSYLWVLPINMFNLSVCLPPLPTTRNSRKSNSKLLSQTGQKCQTREWHRVRNRTCYSTSPLTIYLLVCISARNLAVDNHTVYTPTLYYHYTPHYTWKVMDIHVG